MKCFDAPEAFHACLAWQAIIINPFFPLLLRIWKAARKEGRQESKIAKGLRNWAKNRIIFFLKKRCAIEAYRQGRTEMRKPNIDRPRQLTEIWPSPREFKYDCLYQNTIHSLAIPEHTDVWRLHSMFHWLIQDKSLNLSIHYCFFLNINQPWGEFSSEYAQRQKSDFKTSFHWAIFPLSF